MNKAVRFVSNSRTLIVAALLLAVSPAGAQQGAGPQGAAPQASGTQASAQMPLHHIHIVMLDHGLQMVAQGSSIQMVSAMHMDPKVKQEIDNMTLQHGKEMFKEGKDLIQRSLEGQPMQKLHEESGKTGETMDYTHSLATGMINVANILESMKLDAPGQEAMTLHHIHLAMNHALVMAANGANLMMLGQMGMAPKVDDMSMQHGRKMLSDAQDMLGKIMQSESYKSIVSSELKGMGKPDERPGRTAELAAADKAVIDMLQKMPGAPPAKP
jgi:hypothetical protein